MIQNPGVADLMIVFAITGAFMLLVGIASLIAHAQLKGKMETISQGSQNLVVTLPFVALWSFVFGALGLGAGALTLF